MGLYESEYFDHSLQRFIEQMRLAALVLQARAAIKD